MHCACTKETVPWAWLLMGPHGSCGLWQTRGNSLHPDDLPALSRRMHLFGAADMATAAHRSYAPSSVTSHVCPRRFVWGRLAKAPLALTNFKPRLARLHRCVTLDAARSLIVKVHGPPTSLESSRNRGALVRLLRYRLRIRKGGEVGHRTQARHGAQVGQRAVPRQRGEILEGGRA